MPVQISRGQDTYDQHGQEYSRNEAPSDIATYDNKEHPVVDNSVSEEENGENGHSFPIILPIFPTAAGAGL